MRRGRLQIAEDMNLEARENGGTRKSRRREALLAEMESIFLEEGFAAVTVDGLAKRLKCSKRTLYEIAPTKQDIVLLVVERWLARVRRMGRIAALGQDGPQRRIFAYVRPGVTETKKASRKFLEDIQSFEPALLALKDHQKQRMEMLEEIIEDGISKGRFRKCHAHLFAEILLAAVNRINEPDCLDAAGVGFSEAFDELYDIILNGVLV
ncbi:Transcriptional regulator, TetR family protein [Hyphomonas adhaerens MHS-3]|uniref:Transcriptional regulator, TetR family protein n=2 Tax=Hyphomonas adhaerens TaxID=81029 RepID=A0A069E7I3_9PROT|nr:Transcriptional regulator, TetR family protein [Hyphomonas adhaerens MHS-3]